MEVAREPLPTRVVDTPILPTGYGSALDAGVMALDIHLPAQARGAIDGHMRLLLAWTRAINLTGIRDPEAAALGHVVDSLTAVPLLRRLGADRFLDLGSGGGLPGIPLAIGADVGQALLVEPIRKKADFLTTVVGATGLADRIAVARARAEELAADPAHRGTWPVVTARAVASIAELVELAFPLLRRGGRLVAWKRGDLRAELATASSAVDALGGGTIDVAPVTVPGLTSHVLVVATRTGHVAARYPRDLSSRRRCAP